MLCMMYDMHCAGDANSNPAGIGCSLDCVETNTCHSCPCRRPSTAPGGSRDTYFSDYPCYSAEAAEWQQLKQPPHIQPELTPVHLPQSR